MRLPDDVRQGVERSLADHGLGRRIESVTVVVGGCINNGALLASDTGERVFLKWNRGAPVGMFEAEADGLRALADATRASATGANLVVPHPIAADEAGPTTWLLMEYVEPAPPTNDALTRLGRGLAAMHEADAAVTFGWERGNWIGSLDQANEPSSSWADFWRDRRIRPQLELARRAGRARDAEFDELLDSIPQALADVDRPDLLHGDLWGGNWFADAEGRPVLIDPAVYRGHGEVDLAMSELFGGFGSSFYDAYDELRAITPEYDAFRKALYQLYYLLVHVNLFGGAYEAGSLRAARQVLSELR